MKEQPTSFHANNEPSMETVWLINDQMGMRQTLLKDVGLQTMAIDRHMAVSHLFQGQAFQRDGSHQLSLLKAF